MCTVKGTVGSNPTLSAINRELKQDYNVIIKKNNILLVSILFVLIGIFLRIYQLNFENYWLDEMLSFWVADPNLSLEDTFTRNYHIGQTPPPFDLSHLFQVISHNLITQNHDP